jgi:uncharacterized protein DUF4349
MRRFLLLTTIAVLALVPAACSGGADEGGGGGEIAEGAGATTESAGGGGAAVRRVGAAAGDLDSPSHGSVLQSTGPRIVQTASLSLSVPRNQFRQAVDEARSLAAGLGGFVVSSSASQGTGQRLVSGTLVLRVPERSYAQAMRALAQVGRVESSEEAGQDVSQEFVDLAARRRHLEAVERQLLQLLNQADSVPAALAVQSRLDDVQLELEQVRGRLRYLDDQVTYATISLELHERHAAAKPNDDGRGIVAAWRSAGHGFVTVVGWIFVAAATVSPLVLLLLLAYAMVRLARRTMPAWRRS